MSELATWTSNNERYLTAALSWLRVRLRQLATPDIGAGQVGSTSEPPIRTGILDSWRRKSSETTAETLALPAEIFSEIDVDAAETAMNEAAAMEPLPALLWLQERFGLSNFERKVLLLCVSMELDTRIAVLCARAQDDVQRPYPTFALAMALFDDPAWDVMSPERPLRYWRLLELNQPGNTPLTMAALRADERIVNYVKGLNYVDDRLTPLLAPLAVVAEPETLPPSQIASVQAIIRHVETMANGRPPVVQLAGPDTESKQLVATQAAAMLGLNVVRLPVSLMPTQTADLETLARLWERDSLILPLALYLDAAELDESGEQVSTLRRFLARSNGIFWLDTREIRTDLGRAAVAVEIGKPTPVEQREAWAEALEASAGDIPRHLAGQFNLNLDTIHHIAQTALGQDNDNQDDLQRLWDACLVQTSPQMGRLAERLEPKATWEDIVLPQAELHLLHQIAGQVGQRSRVYEEWGFSRKMNRGFGINALFAGESGTGKTMAAEVIANELRLHLYRIDLAAVVSKYIGETEKNLRRLFDAAEDGGAILFFDEADALFGKRSEVKDSHDRYANIEINYLLQRMEAYRGLAILATNMKSALDPAFIRRLRFIVNFPFPGREERRAIWERVFPAETPLSEIDYAWLARLNLTGGSIHNAALNAAFMAAQKKEMVAMPLILEAARDEYRKLDRPLREADFRWTEPKVTPA
jgi:hypothetical protein